MLNKKEHIVRTEEDRKRLFSAGKPLLGVEIKIANDEGNQVADGAIGEIWVRGASVIKGYYKSPQETEEGFVSPVGKVLRRKVREKYWAGHERSIH